MFVFGAAGLVNAILFFTTGRSFGLPERRSLEQEPSVDRVELSEYQRSSITEVTRDAETHQ